jgi:hypothetical protein
MQEKKKENLTKAFPGDLVKTRSYDDRQYVEAGHYVQRLNRAFDHKWNLSILQFWEKEVSTRKGPGIYLLVKVRLTAGEIIKESFGGHQVIGHELADGYKSAVTDAMKKCCWMLGIGVANWLDLDEEKVEINSHKEVLVDRMKRILGKAGLLKPEARGMKESFFLKHFGSVDAKYIFSKLSLDDLEKGISSLEIELKGKVEEEK